jgi:aminoglycoside phosphotransferase (APT) family kinase protein
MPAAEVDIDDELVRSLLAHQAPALSSLPLRLLANGWDNVLFHLGDELVVRLPRREAAAVLVEHEQRWLPDLAARLPLPIPTPVHSGRPGDGYPWRWSVVPWFEGASALEQPPRDLSATATTLGRFLRALHTPAPVDAPPNPFRGVPLIERSSRVDDALVALADTIDAEGARGLWSRLVDTPPWSGEPVWLHGDLHPGNVVVRDGALAAVVDWGDITSGDPATDLAVGMLFTPDTRLVFRAAAGHVDDATWSRARAWAVALGLAYLANSADNPSFAGLGRRVVNAALRDD